MPTSKQKIGHLTANFAGRGWMALLAVLVTPLYIRFLGIESYGLIGFYTAICAFLSVMDFGLGEAFCREAARFVAHRTAHPSLRTLEFIFWALGGLISVIWILLAPWTAQKWLHLEHMTHILQLMGIAFFFLWPQFFYSKGLQGLQAHLLNNGIIILGTTVRYLGTLAILMWKPTLEAFFYLQIASAAFHTLLALVVTWNKLPMHHLKLSFSREAVSHFWKFSLGMSALGLTSVILQQMDKFLVSHYFSLERFGHYCFAYTIASSLCYFLQPIVSYYYPLFIRYIEENDMPSLNAAYISAHKLIFTIVTPAALSLIFFGKQMIFIWTADNSLAATCAPLVTLLTLGLLLNCFMSISFYVQFAYGYTKALLYQNMLSILLLAPICWLLSHFWGLMGVASLFLLLNLGYIAFNLPIVRRKLLASHN